MGRTINSGKLTKQYVLSKVSQITIFSTYLGLSDSIIQHCIETGELIRSPLRLDAHPTSGFRYDKKGKLNLSRKEALPKPKEKEVKKEETKE